MTDLRGVCYDLRKKNSCQKIKVKALDNSVSRQKSKALSYIVIVTAFALILTFPANASQLIYSNDFSSKINANGLEAYTERSGSVKIENGWLKLTKNGVSNVAIYQSSVPLPDNFMIRTRVKSSKPGYNRQQWTPLIGLSLNKPSDNICTGRCGNNDIKIIAYYDYADGYGGRLRAYDGVRSYFWNGKDWTTTEYRGWGSDYIVELYHVNNKVKYKLYDPNSGKLVTETTWFSVPSGKKYYFAGIPNNGWGDRPNIFWIDYVEVYSLDSTESGPPKPTISLSNSGGDTWKYSKTILIKNDGSPLRDYQLLIDIKPGDFPEGAKEDGSDIRFSDADGNELPYWIEEWDYYNKRARVWVKVPYIPSGTSKIFMYYGNPRAESSSDGDAVFEFFDNFESGYINRDKWDMPDGCWEIATTAGEGKYSIRCMDISTSKSYPAWPKKFGEHIKVWKHVIEFKAMTDFFHTGQYDGFTYQIMLLNTRINKTLYDFVQFGADHYSCSGWTDALPPAKPKHWYKFKFIIDVPNSYHKLIRDSDSYDENCIGDGSYSGTKPTKRTDKFEWYFLGGAVRYTNPGYWYIDDIRVRKYADPEPTVVFENGGGATTLPTPTPSKKISTMYIHSTPSGAEVYIDDRDYGKTPYIGDVAQGTHKIELRMYGFENYVEYVDISSPDFRLNVALFPLAPAEIEKAKNAIIEFSSYNQERAKKELKNAESLLAEKRYVEAYESAKRAYQLAIDIDQDGIPNEKDLAPTIPNSYIYAGLGIGFVVLPSSLYSINRIRVKRKQKRERYEREKAKLLREFDELIK